MSASATVTTSAARSTFLPARKIVRIAMLGFAFLLPSLSWQQAAGAALLALLFNLMLLPELKVDLRKHLDSAGGPGSGEASPRTGILLYPVSALLLVLIYRHHLEVAAAAWAIMALGDSAAALAGEAIPRPRLPWNPGKTWAGFAAFVLAGATGACVLTLWVRPSVGSGKALIVSVLAALLGAAIESAPIGLDDNLTVPLVCGGFIFCALLTKSAALRSNLPYLGRRLLLAAVVNLVFAVLALQLKMASPSGAALGLLLGVIVYLGWGWKSFLILLSFFALGSLATRLGYAQKASRGIAEREGGARSWREALANIGPGALFAILVITTRQEHAFLVAFVAAFAEAAGDTVSSEVGQWLSPRAYLITSFRAVAAGENGGVSLAGSIAGLAASGLIITLGWLLGLTGAGGAAIALAAAVAGNLFDSLLGATLERRALVTNGIVNFAGTAFAGALALAFTLR
jgi:uncharacterized protein (TIGR00297 family)